MMITMHYVHVARASLMLFLQCLVAFLYHLSIINPFCFADNALDCNYLCVWFYSKGFKDLCLSLIFCRVLSSFHINKLHEQLLVKTMVRLRPHTDVSLSLSLIQPASKWMHWATLWRHSDLFWAATSASSQVVIPILC